MSANGVIGDSSPNKNSDYSSEYLATKGRAEQLVRATNLNWTIFRPSLIYGCGGDFTRMLHNQVRLLPIIPIIGDGEYRLMPVANSDIGQAFANALACQQSIGKTYHCCGPDSCTYNELVNLFAAALGKKPPRKIHQPLAFMRQLTRHLERFAIYPVTSDQINMLIQGNCCSDNTWYTDLNITPTPLAEGIRKVLNT
jgi:NADH dehydrogenase